MEEKPAVVKRPRTSVSLIVKKNIYIYKHHQPKATQKEIRAIMLNEDSLKKWMYHYYPVVTSFEIPRSDSVQRTVVPQRSTKVIMFSWGGPVWIWFEIHWLWKNILKYEMRALQTTTMMRKRTPASHLNLNRIYPHLQTVPLNSWKHDGFSKQHYSSLRNLIGKTSNIRITEARLMNVPDFITTF